MPDDPTPTTTDRVATWLGSWANVIAPVTVVSALLFYFGYVASRAQYEYFGVDIDVVGLGTRDYVMRSPQPLLVPLLALTLLGATLLAGHTALRQWAKRTTAAAQAADKKARTRIRRTRLAIRIAVLAGLGLLTAGTILLFGYAAVRNWPLYSMVTPLLIAVGGALVGYGWRFTETLNRMTGPPAPVPDQAAPPAEDPVTLRRTARVLLFTVTAISLFWATATIAQWSGRDLARDTALHLDRLPRVILDTKEPMFLTSPGVVETVLPATAGQSYRYRYRKLRLLIMGRSHMFLVPEKWSASNSTLVVPINDAVRVQFQFQNERP